MTSYDLFQQYAADYIRSRKQGKKTKNWVETIEKDYFCFGEEPTTIRLEVALTEAIQKQVKETICVIHFQNFRNESVYQVLYRRDNSYSSVSFVNDRKGMIWHSIGKLSSIMEFYSYDVDKDELSLSLLQLFKETLKEHASFRLLFVTGSVCFKER